MGRHPVTELDYEVDETARLILMEQPEIRMHPLSVRLGAELGRPVSVHEIGEVWRRYRGFDGRTLPTHDVETGAPR